MKVETLSLFPKGPAVSTVTYRGWNMQQGWHKWHYCEKAVPRCQKVRSIRSCNFGKPMGKGPSDGEKCSFCVNLGAERKA